MKMTITLARTLAIGIAMIALLAWTDAVGATPQKRLTDSNAGGAEATCQAMGGFSSTTATGGVQVEGTGSKGLHKTSTTRCSGGLLGGMSCDNFGGGRSECTMSMQHADESPYAGSDEVVDPVVDIEPLDAPVAGSSKPVDDGTVAQTIDDAEAAGAADANGEPSSVVGAVEPTSSADGPMPGEAPATEDGHDVDSETTETRNADSVSADAVIEPAAGGAVALDAPVDEAAVLVETSVVDVTTVSGTIDPEYVEVAELDDDEG